MALTRRSLIIGMCMAAGFGALRDAAAQTLPKPTGKVVLTISGKISVFNVDRTAQFDIAMLERIGMSSFSTKTPWYDDVVKFEGVPMIKLMQAVGATGETVVATALNDYTTKIPISDFSQSNVLIAIKRNGEYMPVRDKGPLFIVYPYDSSAELKSQKYYSRSAWQLSRISVE